MFQPPLLRLDILPNRALSTRLTDTRSRRTSSALPAAATSSPRRGSPPARLRLSGTGTARRSASRRPPSPTPSRSRAADQPSSGPPSTMALQRACPWSSLAKVSRSCWKSWCWIVIIFGELAPSNDSQELSSYVFSVSRSAQRYRYSTASHSFSRCRSCRTCLWSLVRSHTTTKTASTTALSSRVQASASFSTHFTASLFPPLCRN